MWSAENIAVVRESIDADSAKSSNLQRIFAEDVHFTLTKSIKLGAHGARPFAIETIRYLGDGKINND